MNAINIVLFDQIFVTNYKNLCVITIIQGFAKNIISKDNLLMIKNFQILMLYCFVYQNEISSEDIL